MEDNIKICVSCKEDGYSFEMAECTGGHYVHDACWDNKTGMCKECKNETL